MPERDEVQHTMPTRTNPSREEDQQMSNCRTCGRLMPHFDGEERIDCSLCIKDARCFFCLRQVNHTEYIKLRRMVITTCEECDSEVWEDLLRMKVDIRIRHGERA